MFSAIIFLVIGQNELFAPDKVVRFADHLYELGEYSAALQEYRRYSFLADSLSDSTRKRMIGCFLQTGQYTAAFEETDKLGDADQGQFIKGYILYRAHLYDSSRVYLGHVGLPYTENAQTVIGLSFVHQFRFNDAARYIDVPHPFPEYKNPVAGALLSLFPGGGHFYCGRIGDGLFSFAVVGLSSALAYYYRTKNEDWKFGVCLSAAALFYAGNIYGGVNAVRNYNYYAKDAYRHSVIESIVVPDPFFN